MNGEILTKTLQLLRREYTVIYEKAVVEEVRSGPFLTLVKLSSGFCGLAGTETTEGGNGPALQRYSGEFSPGNIAGRSLSALMEFHGPNPLLTSLKTAALNAISAEVTAREPKYKILSDCDPVSLIPAEGPPLHICVVGAFRSYLKLFASGPHRLSLLELRPEAVPEEFLKFYTAPQQAGKVLQDCDVLIITGATLLNSTLSDLLSQTRDDCRKILVGPTAGLLPGVFFSMGIHLCGTTRVTDSVRVMRAVSEGAFGYHLFGNGAEKITILNES